MDEFYTLVHKIRYELAHGIHTGHTCEYCNENTARGEKCAVCYTEELAEIVGEDLAKKFLILTRMTSKCMGNMTRAVSKRR